MDGGSGKLVKFQQHTRKKPEDEKINLICLVFRYQTTYHKVSVKLQHSFAELWGRFEEFLTIFLTFFPIFFGKFWSAGSSRKPIQKTCPVPLVDVPFFWVFNPFTITQKFVVSGKLPLVACFELGYKIRHRM